MTTDGRADDDWCESPAFFPAGDEVLFGITTRAEGEVPDPPAVLIVSGGLTGTSTVGRNQMYVALARDLAADGFPSMRFDYHGMGESTGQIDEFKLDAEGPFVDDITGAVRFLEGQGLDRVVLVGKCFGSRMALSATGEVSGLAGLVLMSPPVRDFGRGEKLVVKMATEMSVTDYIRRAVSLNVARGLLQARQRRVYMRAGKAKLRAMAARRRSDNRGAEGKASGLYWVSPKFLEPLRAVVERRLPVLILYGDQDDFYSDFLQARQGPLGALLADAGELVELAVVPGEVSGFVQGPVQDAINNATRSWIARKMAGPRAAAVRQPR